MELLEPDFSQKRPTFAQVKAMCEQVYLESRLLLDHRFEAVVTRIRETHANGGVFLVSFSVGPSEAFDWFASRNRLSEFAILRQLLSRVEVSSALPDLQIAPLKDHDPALVIHKLGECGPVDASFAPFGIDEDFEVASTGYEGEFKPESSFLFDGQLAQMLYYGGAYTRAQGDGRAEKEKSLAFCEALFGSRLGEVLHYSTRSPWTPWFMGIAWDWTSIIFDRRTRSLSILVVTDTD